jgi:hypothetical protein
MMIHIEAIQAKKAAAKCCQIMSRHSIEWLIWSVSDEGYMMAPAGSREARAVRRYYPEAVAGTYRRASIVELAGKLIEARESQSLKSGGRDDAQRAHDRKYKQRRRELLKRMVA